MIAIENNFDLVQYLSDGVESLVKDAIKATITNPKETAFLMRYATHSKKSEKLRRKAEQRGEHIPSFLIASITSDCNLRCAGCYAHATKPCAGHDPLDGAEWNRIFSEAGELGVSMILVAGGEPLMRQDVISQASNHPNIIFPIFTNGTLLDNALLKTLDKHRNLVPILSIEGDESQTDSRRGNGMYKRTMENMETLKESGLLFGASITVTAENLDTVTNETYIDWLASLGCKIALFVEYIPFESKSLALD